MRHLPLLSILVAAALCTVGAGVLLCSPQSFRTVVLKLWLSKGAESCP